MRRARTVNTARWCGHALLENIDKLVIPARTFYFARRRADRVAP
jgi:hypothetical protein